MGCLISDIEELIEMATGTIEIYGDVIYKDIEIDGDERKVERLIKKVADELRSCFEFTRARLTLDVDRAELEVDGRRVALFF